MVRLLEIDIFLLALLACASQTASKAQTLSALSPSNRHHRCHWVPWASRGLTRARRRKKDYDCGFGTRMQHACVGCRLTLAGRCNSQLLRSPLPLLHRHARPVVVSRLRTMCPVCRRLGPLFRARRRHLAYFVFFIGAQMGQQLCRSG